MRLFNLGRAQAGFTSRLGGVSAPPYDSLNVGRYLGDSEENVWLNRERIAQSIGSDIIWMNQTHSSRVVEVKPGFTSEIMNCDGMILNGSAFEEVGLAVPALAVQVADCVPVLFACEDGRCIGAVHAGRVGFTSGIIRNTVEEFAALGVTPDKLRAAVGPSICGHCYEVPEDLQASVSRYEPATFTWTSWNTPGLDIRAGVVSQLKRLGVDVVFASKRCTFEDESLFSYRREGTTGRFCGLVKIAS